MSFDVISKATPKRDGADKVTGHTQFLHDLTLPRLAHGAILRTQYPDARVLRHCPAIPRWLSKRTTAPGSFRSRW